MSEQITKHLLRDVYYSTPKEQVLHTVMPDDSDNYLSA